MVEWRTSRYSQPGVHNLRWYGRMRPSMKIYASAHVHFKIYVMVAVHCHV